MALGAFGGGVYWQEMFWRRYVVCCNTLKAAFFFVNPMNHDKPVSCSVLDSVFFLQLKNAPLHVK